MANPYPVTLHCAGTRVPALHQCWQTLTIFCTLHPPLANHKNRHPVSASGPTESARVAGKVPSARGNGGPYPGYAGANLRKYFTATVKCFGQGAVIVSGSAVIGWGKVRASWCTAAWVISGCSVLFGFSR